MSSGPECVVAVLVGCLTIQSWNTMAQLHEQGFQAAYHGMPKDGCLPALQWPPLLRSSCCPEAPHSPIAPVRLYSRSDRHCCTVAAHGEGLCWT